MGEIALREKGMASRKPVLGERCPSIEALKALAHPSRLQILCTLGSQRLAVSEIEQATGITQPALSQQLRVLRDAELVEAEREAKQVFYCLHRDRLDDVVERIGNIIPPKQARAA